jgi:UDPglucose 6-dehydrogenase
MRVGVCGLGVTGKAVADNFRKCHGVEVRSHDIKFEGSSLEAVLDTEIVFLCLPAPTNNKTWEVELSAIAETLEYLEHELYPGEVVIKSTVLPGTCRAFQEKHPSLKIVHNPEFLRERYASLDFSKQKAILISGKEIDKTITAYRLLRLDAEIISSESFEDTELAKYIHNLFLAMKVIFMNEIVALEKKLNIGKSDLARWMATSQGIIGPSHWMVPGPDQQLGFGGMCFPKDLKAFLMFTRKLGITQTLLEKTYEKNVQLRPETR